MKVTKLTLVGFLATLSLTGSSLSAFAAEDSVNTEGKVNFIYGSDLPNPVDPNTEPPEEVITEPGVGTSGQLRIDSVPDLNFGSIQIDASKTIKKGAQYSVYYVKNADGSKGEKRYTSNFIQVNDTRSGKLDWQVSVSASPFLKVESGLPVAGTELVGAKIEFKESQVYNRSGYSDTVATALKPTAKAIVVSTDNSGAQPIFTATGGTTANKIGYGIWNSMYAEGTDHSAYYTDATLPDLDPNDTSKGKNLEANQLIELSVPASATKEIADYVSTITWTMSDTPT